MPTVEFVTDFIYIICCYYLAYHSIKRWLKEKFNHEDIFFWGMAFLLLGVNYTIYVFYPFYPIAGMNYVVHILHTFVFVFLLHAILLNIIGCDYQHGCNICKKKLVRLIMWSILLPFAIVVPIMAFNSGVDIDSSIPLQSLQILGIKQLDILIEVAHSLIALAIFIVIPKGLGTFSNFKIAFFLISMSEVLQIFNINTYSYASPILFQVEWALKTIGILIMFISLHKILQDK